MSATMSIPFRRCAVSNSGSSPASAPPGRFDRPGIVPLGCNIHDNMIAFIDVVDTGFATRTDNGGRASLAAIPGGPVLVRVWHPWLRAPANQLKLHVARPTTRCCQAVPVNLRPPPRPVRSY